MRRLREAQTLDDFGSVLFPENALEPILAQKTASAVLDWLEEIWSADELRAVNILPRQKAIFAGLPGGGKTTLAHHMAARLGMPLAVIQCDQLIDSYLGSTGRNIASLFKAAAEMESGAVLFFDEFDALAMKRGGGRQGADNERNAYVNALLQYLERHDGLIIAATNREGEIDPAIWRRFDIHLTLQMPDQSARERILSLYMAPYTLPERERTLLARDLAGASPALIKQVCEGLKRNLVIGPKIGWDMACGAVFERVLASIEPHQDVQKPPLWAMGSKASGVASLTWPPNREEGS